MQQLIWVFGFRHCNFQLLHQPPCMLSHSALLTVRARSLRRPRIFYIQDTHVCIVYMFYICKYIELDVIMDMHEVSACGQFGGRVEGSSGPIRVYIYKYIYIYIIMDILHAASHLTRERRLTFAGF
jgi:hypothetical protein